MMKKLQSQLRIENQFSLRGIASRKNSKNINKAIARPYPLPWEFSEFAQHIFHADRVIGLLSKLGSLVSLICILSLHKLVSIQNMSNKESFIESVVRLFPCLDVLRFGHSEIRVEYEKFKLDISREASTASKQRMWRENM